MKKINIFVTVFIFAIQNYGIAQWITQFSTPNCTMINSISYSDSTVGIATGFKAPEYIGRILYTSNSGSNWNFSVIPDSTNSFTGSKIISPNLFYACGSIKRNVIETSPSPLLHTPHGFSPYVLEGFSYKGIIVMSTDMGVTWNTHGNVPNNIEYFTSMDFLNANYGFANCSIGNLSPVGALVKTTNGGNNWQFMNLPTNVWLLNSISVIDSLNIISVGTKYTETFPNQIYSGIIFKSTDAGSTWTSQLFPDVNLFSYVHFINNTTGIAVGNANHTSSSQYGGSMYRTTNRGENWVSITTTLKDTTYLRTVKFLSNGTGIIAGNKLKVTGSELKFDKISILKSTDFGSTWKRNYIADSTLIPNGVAITLNAKYYAGGGNAINNSIIYFSSNGGTFINNNSNEVPKDFILYQNYPNPFNPTTTIEYSLSKSGFVSIQVYSIDGKVIRELVNGYKRAGNYLVTFNGEQHASGTYFYRIVSGDFVDTKRMVLVK